MVYKYLIFYYNNNIIIYKEKIKNSFKNIFLVIINFKLLIKKFNKNNLL